MGKTAKYVAKQPDENGYIAYTDEENRMWHELITTQLELIPNRACKEFQQGLETLKFPADRVPQLDEVSKVLTETTGWTVAPVDAVIGFTEFFELLNNKQFPAATFIRNHDEVEYLQEPDIFHEFFGHTPMLTHQKFADYVHEFGKLGCSVDPGYHGMLARLFWLTVEFGLVKTDEGLRALGAGILSSPKEVVYALDSDVPLRQPFDVIDVLRTRYRIDILQPIYFCLESLDQLYDLINQDIIGYIDEARRLGMHEALFEAKSA
ncbi:MAG: phenylalanine 4-monooxygenase [Chromatiales bacterium]|nr:phenylalanine 4-monooxygenase [Chromatiales bacterium]